MHRLVAWRLNGIATGVLVQILVDGVEAGRLAALDVVPPVADAIVLVEHGLVGAQEAVALAARQTPVPHLQMENNRKILPFMIFSGHPRAVRAVRAVRMNQSVTWHWASGSA